MSMLGERSDKGSLGSGPIWTRGKAFNCGASCVRDSRVLLTTAEQGGLGDGIAAPVPRQVSDAEAKARADFDLRWKVALGIEVPSLHAAGVSGLILTTGGAGGI